MTPSSTIESRAEAYKSADYGAVFELYSERSEFRLFFRIKENYVEHAQNHHSKSSQLVNLIILEEKARGRIAEVHLFEHFIEADNDVHYLTTATMVMENEGWKILKEKRESIGMLAESEKIVLCNSYENVFLIDKCNKAFKHLGHFYGDPTCALISDENCCLVGGEHLIVYKDGNTTSIDEIHWIHSMKSTDDSTALLLTDPWADDSAVWELDIDSLSLKKLYDFNEYKGKAYSDVVVW